MSIQFIGIPSDTVRRIRRTMSDAYGLAVERRLSPGTGIPCRHCLSVTPEGEDYLILAHRPFTKLSAYAETGPIFLCAGDCRAHVPSGALPAMLTSPQYIVRAYSDEERILYGTGQVVATSGIPDYARQLFHRPDVSFVDVRSAANNCFQCRILRA